MVVISVNMVMVNDMDKSKEFVLYLYDDMGSIDNKWGNRVILYKAKTIEEMDSFTMSFMGPKNMISKLNDIYGCNYKLGRLCLVNPYTNYEESIRYDGDNYNIDSIKKMYREYLLKNRKLIEGSLFRVVRCGVDINSNISDEDFNRVFYAYYKGNAYKKVRDTYFELIRLGVINRVVNDEEIKRGNDNFSNDVIEGLYNKGDYEEIYGYYDLDDMSSKDIDMLTRNTRGKR